MSGEFFSSARLRARRLAVLTCALAAVLLTAAMVQAQDARTEYRAFWVDTFNTTLNNHADVLTVVNNAKAAKANAIFAQVRRRGDSWYLNSLEPPPDFTPIAAGFDPLQDLITTAHNEGMEVHAFVIVGAVWNKNPNFTPSATLGRPTNPNHVFNQHGGYDATTQKITQSANNWLTRSLLPDGQYGGAAISFQGHRFGSDFWLDLGHPDAAAYTVGVLMHLVNNYQIDGLHLDRIRYPEIESTSTNVQTPSNGTNIGYNQTSIERYQRYKGIPVGANPPATGDPGWMQWRRDQVSNLVRRVYLNAIASKPQLKVSAALIAFGNGPTTENSWFTVSEAYWRVFQDWRSWTEEGILDIAIPMNYKREHTASQVTMYNQWNEWLRNHQYNRAGMVGQGALNNSVEGTLRQTRRALAPSATTGKSAAGIIFYSMATSNVAVAANPLAIPPGNTPVRPFAELAAGLTKSKSVDNSKLYEDTTANPVPIFSQPASIPVFSWKSAPTKGHLMGFARRADQSVLDTAAVTIENLDTNTTRATATDGGGFYGGVDLAPGQYLVRAVLGSDKLYSCVANVTAGAVTTAHAGVENTAPTTSAVVSPSAPDGANNWYTTDVSINLSAGDECSGVSKTEYSTDGGTTWQAYTSNLTIDDEGTHGILYRSTDRAGNEEAAHSLTVMLDKSAPSIQLAATPSVIWPPNGQSVTVRLTGTGADAVSGLASVSYVVTDEYGTPLSIPTRTLSGNQASWTETLELEARRNGDDTDGRVYRIVATITDAAGHTSTATTQVLVPHDRRGGN